VLARLPSSRLLAAAAAVAVFALVSFFSGVSPAFAVSPWWSLTSGSWPTSLPETGSGKVVVTAENTGDVRVDGSVTPVVLEDTLPEHLKVVGPVIGIAGETGGFNRGPVVCSVPTPRQVRCVFEGVLASYELIELIITVKTAGASSSEASVVNISGGGANAATLTKPIGVGAGNPFGVADYELIPEEEGGGVSTQAGVHPVELTTTTVLNTSEAAANFKEQEPVGMAKDLTLQLPAGLIGNPTPLPQCTDAQFTTQEPGTQHNECEAKAAIGAAAITYNAIGQERFNTRTVPVFNLEPRLGEPARFGFEVTGARVYLDTAVRSGGDYGVTVTVSNIFQATGLLASKVTFWGVPGDPAHDGARGWQCSELRSSETTKLCPAGVTKPPPFLSLPTSCTGPMRTTVQADSWQEPHPLNPAEAPLLAEYQIGGLDGCNRLQFAPEIRVTPDGTQASKPTGMNVDVHVPQTSVLNPESLAESNVKDITVALPEGVGVNPAGGNGLAACSEGLVGFTGFGEPEHTATFTPTLPEPLQPGLNFCPNASKIGELTIKSPLLPAGQFVRGFVYLASQNENPFGSLVALYLIAKDPVSGFVFKAVGETQLTPLGQVIGVFKHTPQLAFEDAELHFFSEERAPLATPAHCGAYTTNAAFTPWSGTPTVSASSTFNITSGPNGAPCPGLTLPFSPSLTGGTTNINAGSFSPFTMTMSREDGQQALQGIQLHMPAGLEGILSGVKLCPEAQANEGTCGPESLIGEDTVSAGVGNDPITVSGAKIYITGSYHGAPFGLSIVNPAKAGPFDLEHDTSNPSQQPACDCVVDRSKIEVDPTTAALTVTTNNESEGYAIPHMIDGIPLDLKHINVTIKRPGFTFNPTNCSPLALTGTIAGDEGATQSLSVPFQIANCAALKFTPTLTVSTAGKASKSNGASLFFKIAYPRGAMGSQSWMRVMKFVIPRQIPARLETLQRACVASVFETDRAACPSASIIGHVLVHTQVLPVPLEGPLYFVSYGGAAFPDAVAVLHGYGITIESHGHTFIDRKGVTSATFESVPDVPFESIEVTVPQGRYSEFGANLPHHSFNFCGQHLVLPVLFKAQNGLEIHQNTRVGVTGCKKAKTAKKHNKKKHKHK
jgi:hypothetical protein